MHKNEQLQRDIMDIAMYAIDLAKPDSAVKQALGKMTIEGDVFLVAVGRLRGKWQMRRSDIWIGPSKRALS